MSRNGWLLGVSGGLVALWMVHALPSLGVSGLGVNEGVALLLVVVAAVYVGFAVGRQHKSVLCMQLAFAGAYLAAAFGSVVLGSGFGASALIAHAGVDVFYLTRQTPTVWFGYARFCAVFDVVVGCGLLL